MGEGTFGRRRRELGGGGEKVSSGRPSPQVQSWNEKGWDGCVYSRRSKGASVSETGRVPRGGRGQGAAGTRPPRVLKAEVWAGRFYSA